MELFHHVLGFLKIVKESIKLVPKNGKMMASITMLSLLLPSLLFPLVLYFHKFLTKKLDRAIKEPLWSDSGYNPNPNNLIIYFFALLLVAVAASLFLAAVNSSIAVTAVIIVSTMSYTGEKATMQGLLERMIKTYARQLDSPGNARRSRNPTSILVFLVAASFAYSVTFAHGAITNAIAVVVDITIFIFLRYTSVVGNLRTVVWVVEERREAAMVMEKAEELVDGHRVEGFMVNMLVSVLPVWHVLLGYWMVWRDKCYKKGAIYGVLFFDNVCLAQIFVGVAYTVLYFQCKQAMASVLKTGQDWPVQPI